jgi:DNA (cytosine-5)-methyltransferase 1
VKFISVCSGIEAASVAFNPLGFEAVAFSEIEPFPCAVLAHHYPNTPNWGDMTKFKEWPDAAIDLLCGGTPCQSFSVAGLRKGLDDPRGNLMLTFGAIAAKYRPQWLVWENVPGVLSSNGGADFGSFLGMLGELGYGFAYRVLDAQFFGVAQRRRRVFVVACLGDWRSAAAVLFERHSMSGHPAPSREARQVAPTIPSRSTAGGGLGTDFDCDGGTICVATGQAGAEIGADMAPTINCNHEAPYVAHSLRGEGFDASEDGTGRGTPLVPVGVTIHGTDPTVQKVASYSEVAQCLRARTPGNIDNSSTTVVQQPVAYGIRTANTSSNGWGIQEECTHTLDCAQGVAVAVALRGREGGATAELGDEVQNCLRASSGGGDKPHVLTAMQVRRLTPEECEALQGFPRGYTAIPWRKKAAAECPDGPRYKALGNSWAVPNVRWIGERLQQVEAIRKEQRAAA